MIAGEPSNIIRRMCVAQAGSQHEVLLLARLDRKGKMAALLERGATVMFRPHPLSYGEPEDAGVIRRIHARLAADGALFGSHAATHTPLDGLSAEALAKELAGSRAMLAQWLGRPPVSFAAPFSIEDSRLGWMAAQCGYRIGFSGG